MSDITGLDSYIAAVKQQVQFFKSATRTTVAGGWFSVFDLAGQPGAGTLAGVSAAVGVVPDDTVVGYPAINSFGGGATGRLGRADFGNSVAARIRLYDRLYVCGPQAFNANQAISAPPSYLARVPNGDYKGLEIWAETVTAATLNQAWTVTYTNENGATSVTPATGIGAAPTLGRCFQIPLQAGDGGVQAIQNVLGTVGSAGTANIMVLRPLWTGRVRIANDGDIHDMLKTGLPQVFDTSAFYCLIAADSTSSGVPENDFEVANA